MKVSCPTCKKEVEYEGNPSRPFCSDRCKLIDLGEWAQEKYAVPLAHDMIEVTKTGSSEPENDDDAAS